MILWFLRLFRDYRDLESIHADKVEAEQTLLIVQQHNRELEAESLRLQDRLESAIEDRKELWALVRESLTNERMAYMMQVNESWQKAYGTTPHPEAPSIPEKMQASADRVGPIGRLHRLPSQIISEYTTKFWEGKRPAQAAPHDAVM